MLTLRLYLNIGILYEDNRDFQKAYDYFVKWHETCQEVRRAFECSVLLTYSLTIRDRSDSNLYVLVALRLVHSHDGYQSQVKILLCHL